MIVLDSTMKLQVYTSSAPSTPLKYHLHYVDYTSTFSYDAIVPQVGTFTETVADTVGLVASGKFRAIKKLSIYNASSGTEIVNIDIDVAGVKYPQFSLTVNTLSFLNYNGDGTFTESKTATIGSDLITLSERVLTPTPPGAGTVLLYNQPIANRFIPRFLGPSGLDSALQPSLFGNGVMMITPNTTTTFNVIGTVQPTNVGTLSTPALTASSLRTSTRRSQLLSAATANSASEVRTAFAPVWRGNGAGLGGFFYRARIGIGSAVATQRLMIGLTSSTAATATTIDPSTLTNCVFFGNDLLDANYQIMVNDGAGACAKVNTGFPKNVVDEIYDVTFFCPPNGTYIGYSVTRLNDNSSFSGTLTTELPVSTTFLAPHLYLNNGGTASAVTLDIMKLYIETDQ